MSEVNFRTVLVIGDNHEEIIKKYSADTKVEKYLVMKLDDAAKERKKRLKVLEKILDDKMFKHDIEYDYEDIKDLYDFVKNQSDFDFFVFATKGWCVYDEETGDAYSDVNPNAFYQYERCHQHRLEVTGEEGDFSDPFPLKDGTISYSAHFNEIDWDAIHQNKDKVALNERVWEVVVEGDEPKTDQEKSIKNSMQNRMKYFDNFSSKEEFVKHSTSLWYWGVATEDWYKEVNYKIQPMDWITNFYGNFIKKLEKTNPLLTIYEVKALD